ncbi:MAG: KamA family radical SAM protein, partial [Rectinemataceae bacterium]
PARIDGELVDMLSRFKPLRVVIQSNHPAEISALFVERIAMLIDAGIPVRSQTVLLKGINDSTDTLEALFVALMRAGVDPYYLFQGDLASGTAHFRVPLSRGLRIYEDLRRRLSGMELPRYAVDAPDGAGKLYLPECVAGLEDGFWMLKAPDGSIHRYPEEAE